MKLINNFDELNTEFSKKITLADFYAEWCNPCKVLLPLLEAYENEIENVNFCKINVDKNKDIAKKYGVMSIPTIILFKDGIEVKRNVGLINKEELNTFIKNI